MASIEIHSIQTVSGNQPRIERIYESSGQTFLPGTPVILSSGYIIAATSSLGGTTGTPSLLGLSKEAGANLSTSGVAQQQTYGSVPNESAAVNISRPYFNDGRTGVEIANPDTVFLAQVGPSQSVTQANVGVAYGMTKDSDSHWYVDTSRTGIGSEAVCTIIKIDPNDQSASPRGVYIIFLPGITQFYA